MLEVALPVGMIWSAPLEDSVFGDNETGRVFCGTSRLDENVRLKNAALEKELDPDSFELDPRSSGGACENVAFPDMGEAKARVFVVRRGNAFKGTSLKEAIKLANSSKRSSVMPDPVGSTAMRTHARS